MTLVVIVLLVLAGMWAAGTWLLAGADLSAFDRPGEPGAAVSFPGHEGPSEGHWEAVAAIEQFGLAAVGLSRRQRHRLPRADRPGRSHGRTSALRQPPHG